MTISILIGKQYVSSSGISDKVPLFTNTPNRIFTQGEILQSENEIFERSGNDFLAADYDVGEEQNYVLNEVLYKDAALHFVSEVAGSDIIKQPEDYSPPENLGFGSWANRYAKLGVLTNNAWSKATGNVVHSLYFDVSGWMYSAAQTIAPYWNPEIYQTTTPQSYFEQPKDSNTVYGYFKSDTAKVSTTKADLTTGDIFTGSDGRRYKVGTYVNAPWGDERFQISMEEPEQVVTYYNVPVVLNECSYQHTEYNAFCADSSNCADIWLASTIIRRGDDIYVRSDTNDAIETKIINDVEYTELTRLDQANGWGWSYSGPSNIYAPLDGKDYTFINEPSPIEYTVRGVPLVEGEEEKSTNIFDTIAVSGLIADDVEVTFLPDDGSAAIPTITLYPDSRRDANILLSKVPTTLIAYAPRPITGEVHIKLLSSNKVRIGGIALGQKVDSGFTNLVFSNKFKDYSPYEKDQWGNILYTKGVKTNIYTGTVDIELVNYDMTNRLMKSIGGETVALNGSDSVDNTAVDNKNFFASTMVVGRIRNFNLRTKLDNKLMHQMATYTFEIEEDV